MRVKQAYISGSVDFFRESFLKKYNLRDFCNSKKPFVLFGLYKDADYDMILKHKQPIIVVWAGSDSMKGYLTKQRAKILRHVRHCRHIAQSSYISRDLTKNDIPHKLLPISPAIIDLDPCKRGDHIYMYYGAETKKGFYGYDKALEVEKRTGLKIIYTTKKTFNKEQLHEAYRNSFVGLRLTPRDGVSVTVVELGMMGRRCVFNGDSPSALKWKTVDDICRLVEKEYKNRHNDDAQQVSDSVKKYLNVNEKWLNV